MTKKASTPALRFKGFTYTWEQRRLGEVLSLIKDGTHGTHQDVEDGPLLLSAKNIKHGEIRWDNTDRRIAQADYEKIHSTFSLENGDILLTIVGSIGEVAILRNSDGITFQRSVAFLRPNKELKSEFLYAEVLSEHFQKELDNRKSTSAQPGIYLGDLGEIPFTFPKDIAEQKQIGTYFRNLDRLITLHQRKYDKLTNMKKSMLEKMFPNNGANVPEIRFKGFTDAWKQRKAKDLCSISTGKSNTQDRVDDGIYPFYVRSPIVEHSSRYLFDEEAVLTVGDGVGTGKVFHYVNGKYDLHQRVYRMFDFSEEITAKYFYYYFSNHFYDRVMAMTAKTSVDSVRYEMIADMDIALPKVQEQMAISDYFDRLDNLITLHQRELEKLKNLKKACLEKMFV